MDFPSSYAYGGGKRKRKDGEIDIRAALEAHVRESLDVTRLKAQDKKLMPWTLGELSFFAYLSVQEQHRSRGVPAREAVKSIDFEEAASFIADERGVLSQTPAEDLRRVSANMTTRFWQSRLDEAVVSFIDRYHPSHRNVAQRGGQPSQTHPQRRNPANGCTAPTAAASTPSQRHPPVIQPQIQNQNIAPAQERAAASGPGQSQSRPTAVGRAAIPTEQPPTRPPRADSRPSFRSHGTQTWGPAAPPTAGPSPPPPQPRTKQEPSEPNDTGPLGYRTTLSAAPEHPRAPCSRPSAPLGTAPGTLATQMAPAAEAAPRPASPGRPHAVAGRGASAGPGGGWRRVREDEIPASDDEDRDADRNQQRLSGFSYDRQALRQQLLRPPTLGRLQPDRPYRGDDDQNYKPQQHDQQQYHHQDDHHHHHLHTQGNQHLPESLQLPAGSRPRAGHLGQEEPRQHTSACQTTPSSRGVAVRRTPWGSADYSPTADAVQWERNQQEQQGGQLRQVERQGEHLRQPEHRQGQHEPGQRQEHARGEVGHQVQQQQQRQEQRQPGRQAAFTDARQGGQARGLPSSEAPLPGAQPALQRQHRHTEQQQHHQQQQDLGAAPPHGDSPGPSLLRAGRVPLAQRSVAEERAVQATAGVADGVGRSGSDGNIAGGPPGAVARGTSAGFDVDDALMQRLRDEYGKRLSVDTFKQKLSKHLCKEGNSKICQYCRKEGLSWTLLEVAAYGVALQKVADKPFAEESAVRFLAWVKDWRPAVASGGAGGSGGPAPRGAYVPPPPPLVEKVAGIMSNAVAKYHLVEFIERQRRKKKPQGPPPPPPPQEQRLNAAAVEVAVAGRNLGLRYHAEEEEEEEATAPAAATRGGGAGPSARGHGSAYNRDELPYNADGSPAETHSIGVTAPTLGTSSHHHQHHHYQQQHSTGASDGDDRSVRSGGGEGEDAGAAGGPGRQHGPPGPGTGKRGALVGGVRKRGRRSGAGGSGNGGLEERLRRHLRRLGVSKLRQRNKAMGVGWTLLELVEVDRDVRLQQGCDEMRTAAVVDCLLQSKLAAGTQLPPPGIQAVCVSVCKAYDKYQLETFVAAEVDKRRKSRQRRGLAAAKAAAAAATGPAGDAAAGTGVA